VIREAQTFRSLPGPLDLVQPRPQSQFLECARKQPPKFGARGQVREPDGRRVLRIRISVPRVLFVKRFPLTNHLREKAEGIAQVGQAIDPGGE
jgi:hypothetical protein